jgi:hypothetical protein
MRSQIQKKAASSSYSPPAQKAASWQRPFSDPVHDAQQDGTVQSKIAPGAGFNLLQMKLFPDAPTPVQAKLSVGAPGDKYEQQADSVATKVMTMPAPENEEPIQREALPEEKKEEKVQTKPLAATVTPLVQRETAAEEPQEEEVQAKALSGNTIQRETAAEEPQEEEVQAKALSGNTIQRETAAEEPQEEEVQAKALSGNTIQRETAAEEPQEEEVQAKAESEGKSSNNSNLESQLNGSKGGGSPLPDEVRAFMEPRFGADFSGVRVHTDGAAVQMNKELGAQAFAHGSDIYYGAGKSPGNDELTAHEMTHVLQQTAGEQLQAKVFNAEAHSITIAHSQDGWVQRYPKDGEIFLMTLADSVLKLGADQVKQGKKTATQLVNEAFWTAYPQMYGKKITDETAPEPKKKQMYIDAWKYIYKLYENDYKPKKETTQPGSEETDSPFYDPWQKLKDALSEVSLFSDEEILDENFRIEDSVNDSQTDQSTKEELLSYKARLQKELRFREGVKRKIARLNSDHKIAFSDAEIAEIEEELFWVEDDLFGRKNHPEVLALLLTYKEKLLREIYLINVPIFENQRNAYEPVTTTKIDYTLTGPTEQKNYVFRGKTADAEVWSLTFVDGITIGIVAPKALEPGYHNHTVQQAAEAVSHLPKFNRSVINTILLNPVVNPDDNRVDEYDNPRSYMTAGVAGVVTIYPGEDTESLHSDEEMQSVMIHETGHTWAFRTWGTDETKGKWLEWKQAMDKDHTFVSNYAKKSIHEDVAETINVYVSAQGSPRFKKYRQVVPHRFAMLDREYK